MKKILIALLIASSVHADRVSDYVKHMYNGSLFKPLAIKQKAIDNNKTEVDIILTHRSKKKTILFYQRVILKIDRTTTTELSKKVIGTKTIYDWELNNEINSN